MTPHISRKRSMLAISTAVAAGALLAAGLTTGASAQPVSASGAPVALSATARADLLQDASADTAATADRIGLGAKEKLVVRDVVKDADGTTHTRYERTYDGLPVLGGDLVVHTAKSGKVKSVTKATKASVKVASTDAKLGKSSVAKAAESTAARAKTTKADAQAPRKVIWAASGKPVLAYETVVTGMQKDGTPSRLHVITDATTGKKLFERQAIENGTGNSQYSGKVEIGSKKGSSGFDLTDDSRGGHSTFNLENGQGEGKLFTDDDDTWGNGKPDDAQTAAVDAAYGAQVTWDYYKTVHGREGIKGDGKGATSRVHYGDSYVNAFWDDSCFCMTYGDGEGNKKPLTSIDVAAHEMSHGVTSATGNMEYSGESGGLNEATSDIFGASVEFNAKSPEDIGDYLIGEEIDINGDGSPLRYMDKPSKDGKSLDSWSADAGNVDVHYSSGIANHFFYLLSEGSGAKEINGVKYDSPTADGSKVEGIGRDKAEKIWFKALTAYFTSTTDYKAAREGTLKAATDLYGADSAEVKAVGAAWTGVAVK
ncbi:MULTISPECIES: M4 family metallopeptidase [Streptomyces]|uniref:Neutral metalloproteinase n=1 Tax=Streptomyces venezuelae TaxID=54571 RepID=A0A5P2BGF0_STRVZ|nr:M4 family metallopeptidase [Streptomyces venezuelae]MYY87380.1 peptidase M4 family protein [Streptomyces sp. SID335]NDZ90287.1 M4 family metallopeptidase [Streptomyces sp. SID10115]NEA04163.1 M4 family metallopeptidase [Streptomyces sp. SID10116]NEB43839.1 M4 family metallopeptidase [Streptomyces sp. SID339]QES29582.1 peptidase M4 family protein [Streptomyces venezuelae]